MRIYFYYARLRDIKIDIFYLRQKKWIEYYRSLHSSVINGQNKNIIAKF